MCGRFFNSQLNRELIVPKEKGTYWAAASAAVISFLGAGTQIDTAQEKPKTEQREITNTPQNQKLPANEPAELHTISGVVLDPTNMPLPGATVTLIETGKSVQTDFDGYFEIDAKEGDILEISYIGFEPHRVTINKNTNYIIALNGDLLGDVVMYRKTFFGRLFYKIGNLFR